MRHDDQCDFNAVPPEDCGCARRAAQRARERNDISTAYRFVLLGAHVPKATFPFPRVARPIRISLGEKFAVTKEGAFVLEKKPIRTVRTRGGRASHRAGGDDAR